MSACKGLEYAWSVFLLCPQRDFNLGQLVLSEMICRVQLG